MKKELVPMEHLNIGEFNRGQASKLIRNLVENDKAAFIQKNGKPIAVVISYERYERLLKAGIDLNASAKNEQIFPINPLFFYFIYKQFLFFSSINIE